MGETHTSWSVLYCKAIYKQRKVKPWLDGTIKISKNKITLYNCDDQIIDSCFNASVIPLLCEDYTLNFDYHLCTLESPCQDQYDDITQPKSIPNQIIKSKSIPMNPKSNSIVKKSQPKHKMNNIVCGNQKLVNENNDSKTTIKSITRSKDELIQLFSISKSDKNIKSTLPKNNLIHLFNSNQSTMKIIDCVDLVSEDIISKPIHVHSNSNTSIINNPNSSNINNANSSIINNSNTSITNNNMEEKRNSFNTKTLNKTANVCNDDKSDGGILAPKATNKTKLKVGLKKHGDPKINVNDSSPQLINSSKENLDTGPKRIKLSTTFQNLKQPLIDKHFKCKENSSILSSTVVPSIRKNHHLKDTQLQPSSSNNQLGLIFEMPVLPNAKLTRQSIIPNRFKSIYTYQETLKQSIIESMNIDLQQLYIQFYKHLNAGVNTDTKFRYKSISFYQDLTMTSFDGGDSKPFIFNSTLKARKDHVLLNLVNKEHHSKYSKDDIWILSDSINFTKVHFFSSFYFGPSKSVIELVPYSLKHHSFQHWIGHPGLKLYGIRALSASSEMMILRMFKDQLFETPLVYSLFDPSIETVKKSTGLIAEGKYQDFTKLVQDSIIEFKMNPYQSKVIENFCASLNGSQYPITLVHGVFGSGKSYLVTVLIIILYRAFTSDYMLETTRIVLSSMTNVAVDRILLNLLELDFTDFVRVGSIRKIAKPILPFTCQFKSETHDLKELNEMHGAENLSVQDRLDIQKAIKKFQESDNRNLIVESFVIGITCLATNFDVLDGIECPIVILDECSQMTEPMSLLPICRFKSEFGLFVGDPKQLPPTLSVNFDSELKGQYGLERTLFERLAGSGIDPIMLRSQYRCHPTISSLSNSMFYHSMLVDGITADKRPPVIKSMGPLSFVIVKGNESKQFSSYQNETEAQLIISMVKQFNHLGIDSESIGIISLYKSQLDLINKLSKSNGLKMNAATVDSFQGSEKQIIILSTVRTRSSEFLEDPRRINVALTRGKCHLILLVSDSMYPRSNLWKGIMMRCSQPQVKPGVIDTTQLFEMLQD